MKLKSLFPEFNNSSSGDIEISSMTSDSRCASKSSLFFAVKGLETDGHLFIDKAIANGAVAVVHQDDVNQLEGIVYIKKDDVLDEINRTCNIFFGKPSEKMTVYGVTGTNGKSTTTCIIKDLLEKMSHKCGYMGTIAVRYGSIDKKPNLTTPDPFEIHETLKAMYDAGMDSVSMEVSSHGLALKRTGSVDFDVAVFTNLTWDHLDFHKTMDAYFEAKQSLFSGIKKDGVAVLNADDESVKKLSEICASRFVTYGMSPESDYRISDIRMNENGTEFELQIPSAHKFIVKTNLVADYNISNLTAAIASIHQMGFEIEDIIKSCLEISQVDGRMEKIKNDKGINVIVDYAHTPDGFEKIFEFANKVKLPGARVYAVFGSAGKRDKEKRPVLGEIAGRYCDRLFLTEEDPRDEAAEDIAKMIKGELSDDKAYIIPDRVDAIAAAINHSRKGDIVLILGKGDEKYLDRGAGKEDWPGDNVVAEELLNGGK